LLPAFGRGGRGRDPSLKDKDRDPLQRSTFCESPLKKGLRVISLAYLGYPPLASSSLRQGKGKARDPTQAKGRVAPPSLPPLGREGGGVIFNFINKKKETSPSLR